MQRADDEEDTDSHEEQRDVIVGLPAPGLLLGLALDARLRHRRIADAGEEHRDEDGGDDEADGERPLEHADDAVERNRGQHVLLDDLAEDEAQHQRRPRPAEILHHEAEAGEGRRRIGTAVQCRVSWNAERMASGTITAQSIG